MATVIRNVHKIQSKILNRHESDKTFNKRFTAS